MTDPKRLFDFPYYQLEKNPKEVMMTSKLNGEWQTISTQEFVEKMNLISKGLLKLGIKPGDKVVLISHNNRLEWNICDTGILQIGAIDVPVYPTMTEKDYDYIFNHAEVKVCIVSNEELFQKVQNVNPSVQTLEHIYTFEDVPGAKNWSELLDLGREGDDAEVKALSDKVNEDDLATLIYTSGTTGLPKGVMLTHKNIASNAITSTTRLPMKDGVNARVLSFLPICHIYERMLHYMYFYVGATVYCAESLETIKEDLNYSNPHKFSAVPRLLEKFYDGIVAKGRSAGGVKTMLFNWAVNLALKWEPEEQNGGFYEFKLGIARKLVFSKVKAALGMTNILAVSSGSAALQPRLARFFNGAGIPVLEGYGLTETSPVISVNTINDKGMIRIGTVGKTLPEVEVKIAEDGEILAKGPNVMMGYYKDEEKTAEVLNNGWFHTGDIGVVEDGFIRITDRKKEMFKTSGGKYVAPQLVENALKESLFVDTCIVIGEGRKHPSALVVVSLPAAVEWCKRHDIPCAKPEDVVQIPQFIERIEKDIEESMERFGHWERVKRVQFLATPFTVEGGELTPKLSLKRKPIMVKYADVIDRIYDEN